ncbi:PAS domain-containing protein [Agrobacterium sp. Rnr]|uniref:histidine kinase n=1 Tax=Agrobacterium burrii TaxID=2815339 RepID=A0ABS3ECE2_9HYPH|nr:PAS domain-containing protein [Agrobacterium burrii]
MVLTHKGAGPDRNPAAARVAQALGNVSFLERPFHPTTFISVVESAGKNRRRQLEARNRIVELRESELNLKTALLAGNLGTWSLDLSSWVLGSSPEFRQIFGRCANKELTYDELTASVHPDDRQGREEGPRRSLDAGEDYVAEYRVIWPDHSMHWAEVRGRLVHDQRGKPQRLIGVGSDITSRKHAEALKAQIAQRQDTEQKLLQSQKLEAIGQLLRPSCSAAWTTLRRPSRIFLISSRRCNSFCDMVIIKDMTTPTAPDRSQAEHRRILAPNVDIDQRRHARRVSHFYPAQVLSVAG